MLEFYTALLGLLHFFSVLLGVKNIIVPTKEISTVAVASSSVSESTKIINDNESMRATTTQLLNKIIWEDTKNKYTLRNNKIYLNGIQLNGIDAESFVVVNKDPFPNGKYSNPPIAHYFRDKNNVFYDGKLLENADPDSFKTIWFADFGDEHVFSKDINNAYYKGRVIFPKVDTATFEVLSHNENGWRIPGNYSKDFNRVYYENNVVIGADPKTFDSDAYQMEYARDKEHVYLEGKLLLQLNPETFKFP